MKEQYQKELTVDRVIARVAEVMDNLDADDITDIHNQIVGKKISYVGNDTWKETGEDDCIISREPIDNIAISDDYASIRSGPYEFYYGYESLSCRIHGDNNQACEANNCDETEWAFTVLKNARTLVKVPGSSLGRTKPGERVEDRLMAGLSRFLVQLLDG